jgi:hypothetical protein
MACKIFRNDNNEIVKVEAPNKKESLLFKSILETSEINGDKELALRQWAEVYTSDFKDRFGDWLNEGNFEGKLDINGEPLIDYIKSDVKDSLKDIKHGDNDILQEDKQWKESKKNIFIESVTEIESDNYKAADLTTIDGKIENVYNTLQDTIDHQFRLIKRLEGDNKDTRVKEFEKLVETIKKYKDVNKIRGVLVYLKHAEESITKLEFSLSKKNKSNDDMLNVIKNYKTYEAIFNVIDDISQLYKDSIRAGYITDKPAIHDQLSYIKGKHVNINNDIQAIIKDYLRGTLNDIKNFDKVETKWNERLESEYNSIYGTTKSKSFKTNWINSKLREFNSEIQADVNKATDQLIDNVAYDISGFSKNLMSGLETNSDIVQLFTSIAMEVRDNIIEDVTVVDGELKILANEYTKGNGSYNPRKQFKDIVEQDSKGDYFFKGEYKLEFMENHYKLLDLYSDASELRDKLKNNPTDKELITKLKELQVTIKVLKNSLYISKNSKIISIKPIWKNDFSKVSSSNIKVLDKAYSVLGISSKNTNGFSSIVRNVGFVPDTTFYRMPSVTASTYELAVGGNLKGLFTDKVKDLTTIKPDDIGFATVKANSSGEILKELPIHYRGKIDSKTQSLDILTILKLEAHNGIAYKHRSKKEIFMNMVIDMTSNKNFFVTKGTSVSKLFSRYAKNNKELTTSGHNSNTVAKLKDIMDTFMYDITKEYHGDFGPIDTQKLIGLVNGYTGMIGMSMNYHSALVNLTGGYAQFIISAVAKDVISIKDLKKAFAIYHKNTVNNVKDLNTSGEDSFVNKLNVMFDTFGGQKIGTESFIKDKGWKKFAGLHGLTFLHQLGEHQLQSIITMAVLNSTEALDNSGTIITNDGKSQSVLDSLSLKGDSIKVDPRMVYTSHSPLTKWNEGGRVQMQSKIKYKMFETLGRYDDNHKSAIEKTWYGSLLIMYRRFFVSMGVSRFRNLGHSIKTKESINEELKYYSHANKRFEEGYYTTTARFIIHNLGKNLKNFNVSNITKDYNKLTDYEKGNLKKTTIEVVLANVMAILATAIAQAADEDDDELLFFIAYELRRMESELKQFTDPNEAITITKSPFASMRTIESGLQLLGKIISPSTWGEEYKSGKRKGELKINKLATDLIPVWGRIGINNEEKFNYLDNLLTK